MDIPEKIFIGDLEFVSADGFRTYACSNPSIHLHVSGGDRYEYWFLTFTVVGSYDRTDRVSLSVTRKNLPDAVAALLILMRTSTDLLCKEVLDV